MDPQRHAQLLTGRRDIFSYVPGKTVVHKDKDRNDVETPYRFIGSQVIQGVVAQVKSDIRALAAKKENGGKVGALKFVSEVNSVDLKQHGVTYRLDRRRNRVAVQGIRGWMRVRGMGQLNDDMEFANAKLVHRADGYHLLVTTYTDNAKMPPKKKPSLPVKAADFGCKRSFSVSTGETIEAKVKEPHRIKVLQQQLARREKGSKGRWQTRLLLRKEHLKLTQRKDGMARQIAHDLMDCEVFVFQDEQLPNWQKTGHGKAIHCGCLGRVKSILKRHLMPQWGEPDRWHNVYMLSKWLPTTRLCHNCGTYNDKLKPSDRVFDCDGCGLREDRDFHAANNEIWMYLNKIGEGLTEFKRASVSGQVDRAVKAGRIWAILSALRKGRSPGSQPEA